MLCVTGGGAQLQTVETEGQLPPEVGGHSFK